jgi:Fur family ferric uptake transcriptional regulator
MGADNTASTPRGVVREVTVVVEPIQLREAGLKVTTPRMKILGILAGDEQRHMSAEDVYRRLLESEEDIGLATVYRVLTQFESAGLVTRHRFEGGSAVFELDDGEHHDHIICQQCGHVVEFVDEEIEARQEANAADHGFEVSDHALIIYGNCIRPNCPNLKKAPE